MINDDLTVTDDELLLEVLVEMRRRVERFFDEK